MEYMPAVDAPDAELRTIRQQLRQRHIALAEDFAILRGADAAVVDVQVAAGCIPFHRRRQVRMPGKEDDAAASVHNVLQAGILRGVM